MSPIRIVKMGRFGQLGGQKRRKFKSTSFLKMGRFGPLSQQKRRNLKSTSIRKMGRLGQLGRQKRRKFTSTSILVITRGKREVRTCWPSFPALVFGHSFLGVLLLGVCS
jgi:hypothetical protein